jgi:hypothetical protein
VTDVPEPPQEREERASARAIQMVKYFMDATPNDSRRGGFISEKRD